jgi:hypothetical protein
MRLLLSSLPLLAVAVAPSLGADGSNLDLTIGVLQQQYCRGDAEVGFVRLGLQLNLRNVGRSEILLYRGAVRVDSVMLAASEQAYRERVYLVTFRPTMIPAATDKEPADSDLQTLPPGGSRSMEDRGMLPLRILPTGETSPGPGEYWLGITATGAPLRPIPESWKARPEIFTGTLRSSPTVFRIEPSIKFAQCR